jgi:dihydrofolate reductase
MFCNASACSEVVAGTTGHRPSLAIVKFGVSKQHCDHRDMVADDEMHRYWTRVMDAAGAMLFGRRTYELMEDAWPQVA